MKKVFLIALFAIGGFTTMNAQENLVKVNPIAILGGTDLVSYERALSDNTSFMVSGAVGGFKFGTIRYKSVGAGLQYRYYFDEVLSGWYAAGDVGYQNGTTEFDDVFGGTTTEDIDFSNFNVGARAGYQWIYSSGFSFELNFGLGYRSFNYDSDNTTGLDLKASGILPSGSLALGYSF